MTLTSTGGMLHGTWSSDSMLTYSDARLKTGIVPIHQFANSQKVRAKPFSSRRKRRSPLARLLMGLRPVAYRYRRSKERLRFGFLTQDLEHHLPEVVQHAPHADKADKAAHEASPGDTKGAPLKG